MNVTPTQPASPITSYFFPVANILGMNVDVVSVDDAVAQITKWAKHSESRYVCVANVHMCMEAFDDPNYQAIVNDADLTVADGRPLFWAQRLLGCAGAQQVRGVDLTMAACLAAEKTGMPIGLYGATPECLKELHSSLHRKFPKLSIACTLSPPFRPLTQEENAADATSITRSGARILLVGLGCPKQEMWMAAQRDTQTSSIPGVSCVMIGVGAAFDFLSGSKKAAPRILQRLGLEWLFRFCCEPRRLWRRYFTHNPRFIYFFGKQLLKHRIFNNGVPHQ